MTALSGDIWMLLLQLDSYVIWYIPENIEKFDIDLKNSVILTIFKAVGTHAKNRKLYRLC